MPTNPAPGVMATSPAKAPEAAPKVVGLPMCHHSNNNQPTIPAAAAISVVPKACTARPLAARALPALKPNQPNQMRAQPSKVKGRLCGVKDCLPIPIRAPSSCAVARPAAADAICTTAPPAKSTAPILAIQPPPQTQ